MDVELFDLERLESSRLALISRVDAGDEETAQERLRARAPASRRSALAELCARLQASSRCAWRRGCEPELRLGRLVAWAIRDAAEGELEVELTLASEAPRPERPLRVTVRSGETLRDLARRSLGDERHWPLLARANGIEDGLHLTVGRSLIVPAR